MPVCSHLTPPLQRILCEMGDIVTKDKFGKMHSYKPYEMAAQARLDD